MVVDASRVVELVPDGPSESRGGAMAAVQVPERSAARAGSRSLTRGRRCRAWIARPGVRASRVRSGHGRVGRAHACPVAFGRTDVRTSSSERSSAATTEPLTIGEVPAQRRRLVRPALLRGARVDHVDPPRLRSPPLPPPRPAADRLHRVRAARRPDARRDRPRARAAAAARRPHRRDWARLSRGWATRIDERIAELERLKAGLTECIGCGCLSLDRCRLTNPGDRAAGLGPGPASGSATRRPAQGYRPSRER